MSVSSSQCTHELVHSFGSTSSCDCGEVKVVQCIRCEHQVPSDALKCGNEQCERQMCNTCATTAPRRTEDNQAMCGMCAAWHFPQWLVRFDLFRTDHTGRHIVQRHTCRTPFATFTKAVQCVPQFMREAVPHFPAKEKLMAQFGAPDEEVEKTHELVVHLEQVEEHGNLARGELFFTPLFECGTLLCPNR